MPSQAYSIPLGLSHERKLRALHGQLQHHRDRRLAASATAAAALQGAPQTLPKQYDDGRRRLGQQLEQQQSKGTVSAPTDQYSHPASWRQVYPHDRRQLNEGSSAEESSQSMTTVGLSNCHLVLYSGEIGLGLYRDLPVLPQRFLVDFDTGSSDFWVPSAECDETCRSNHPTWRLYDATESDTYAVASDDVQRNAFHVTYEDGEEVKGEHAQDTLWLGIDGSDPDQEPLRVDQQVFAQVTHVQDFSVCEEEEGVLGLANALSSTHQFPTVLRNLMHQNVLPNNVFSLYLDSQSDDYSKDTFNDIKADRHPTMSSQLVLGGVDQTHYVGCLEWHPLLQSVETTSAASDNDKWSSYWALAMDDVKVGGTSLVKPVESSMIFESDSNLASKYLGLIDSGSSYIVGPQESVAHLIELNRAKCFVLQGDNNPQQVPCDNAEGFDGAVLNSCQDPFFNLEFVVNGSVYVLEKEDLMVTIDTLFGPACILRIVGVKDIQGWVLGDAFLNKFYAAFDFENQRIGLAPAAKEALDVCDLDTYLDINKFWIEQDMQGGGEIGDGDFDLGEIDEMRPPEPSTPEDEFDLANEEGNQTIKDEEEAIEEEILGEINEEQQQEDFEDQWAEEEGVGDDDLAIDDLFADDGEEVFDYTDVEVKPPNDVHHEPPAREPLPNQENLDVIDLDPEDATSAPEQFNISGTSPVGGSLQPPSSTSSAASGVAIYVVISAIMVGLLAFVIRRRRSNIQRQQKQFQSMYQDAERAVVDSHKNTNYRDHSKVAYRDEELMDGCKAEEDGRDGFVLDAKMLDRMN